MRAAAAAGSFGPLEHGLWGFKVAAAIKRLIYHLLFLYLAFPHDSTNVFGFVEQL